MVKAKKFSDVAKEIKKEYLRDHLDKVKNLANEWMSELHPPEPLKQNKDDWGWPLLYRSSHLENPEYNHILRHHLKSRTLWSHYGNWTRELNDIWEGIGAVKLAAKQITEKRLKESPWAYTAEYVPLALWKAFDLALGTGTELPFTVPDDNRGLKYGAYLIERSADSQDKRQLVEKQYRNLICELSQGKLMKDLTQKWLIARDWEGKISSLVDNIVKSGDIFYVCRYCRHLWN
jgi:hypothetical protein